MENQATKDNQRLSGVDAPPSISPTAHEVKEWYKEINALGQEEDLWHKYSTRILSRYIFQNLSQLPPSSLVLNAGSGDGSFELSSQKIFHLDLVISSIIAKAGIVGNIESIGIQGEAVDALVCVGSVLNYADPVKAINEFSRVVKRKGHLILEFERISSRESLQEREESSIVYYRGIRHYLRLYSEKYIKELLQDSGFLLYNVKYFHIASNIFYNMLEHCSLAGALAVLDPIFCLSSYLRSKAKNVIFSCVRRL